MIESELRIGNLIYDDFNEIHIVEKIESKKFNDWNGSGPSLVVFSKPKDKNNNMYECDEIKGIPLTEEIILKCGFVETAYNQYTLGEQTVAFSETESLSFWIMGTELTFRRKHLHELQNLYFTFYGEELNTSELL